MAGAYLDPSMPEHHKRRRVCLAADGLWVRALAQAAKDETDGFVDDEWMRHQGRGHERRRALADALEHRLLEQVKRGETRELHGQVKAGLRPGPITLTVGPFPTDGYIVHDFLDHNRSSVESAERRSREAAKKRRQRGTPKLWTGLSPVRRRGDSPSIEGESSASASTSLGDEHGERREDHARSGADELREKVVEIMTVFAAFDLSIGEESVLNAISRFESVDHMSAARGCAEHLRRHPDRDAGMAYHRFMERELHGRAERERERENGKVEPTTQNAAAYHDKRKCPDCGSPDGDPLSAGRCVGCWPAFEQRTLGGAVA